MENLTIAIPTYNRETELIKTILAIFPQIENEKILIIDNASDYDVKERIHRLVSNIDSNKIKNFTIIRNECNIGSAGNIIKCFENITTDYMWLLGDDDEILKNALDNISSSISNDYAFINFSSNLCLRKENIVLNDIHDFIIYMNRQEWGNFLFMSVGVYNMQLCKQYLPYAYRFISCLSPQVIFSLMAIANKNKILLSNRKIVNNNLQENGNHWNIAIARKGLTLLFDLPLGLNKKENEIFNKIIIEHPINIFSQICKQNYFLKIFELKRLLKIMYIYSSWCTKNPIYFCLDFLLRCLIIMPDVFLSITYNHLRKKYGNAEIGTFHRL